MKVIYSEAVKDIKSATEFCSVNKIIPKIVIVVWEEEEDDIEFN